MYNLNYTYLTELEVDTRQTFSDLSSDLLLLNFYNSTNKSNELRTTNSQSLVSSWQDFFWKTDNANKKKLNITFTDISIERQQIGGTQSEVIDMNGSPVENTEMMSIAELNAHYAHLDTQTSWAGNRTFSQLESALVEALKRMHTLMTASKLYPKGSIVVSKSKPPTGFGTWQQKDAAYLSENLRSKLKNVCELSATGYHEGQSRGRKIGSNLGSVILSAEVNTDAQNHKLVPAHTHKLELIPESGSGGGDGTEQEFGPYCTYTNLKRGSSTVPYSGQHKKSTEHYNDAPVLTIATDSSTTIHRPRESEGGGKGKPSFSVQTAKVDPKVSSINVAPKTYAISASIWEKQ